MEIKITKSMMMIFLLEECNFSCPHCVREDEPMHPGYKLSFEQLQLCLSDCRRLGSVHSIQFSGGETTLWTEGNRDLTDVLVEVSRAGFSPGFTTNGSLFVDYTKCRDFFQKYVDAATTPLHAYLSIDTFHGNFDVERGRCQSLDSVLKYKSSMRSHKRDLLNITPMAVVSKDSNSLLPDEMIRHYETLGVPFGIIPLAPEGKAKSLAHLCPDLSSDKPEDLGAYYRFRPKQPQKKPTETQHMVLIGDDYYLHKPKWRIVAQLGHLPDTMLRAYS